MRVALLLLLSGLLQAQCHEATQETAQVNKITKAYLRRDTSDRELSEPSARVLVQYTNHQGKDEALARSSRLYHDFDEQGVVSIEVTEEHLRELSNNPNIASIEEDGIFQEQGYHESDLTMEDPEHRRLAQTTPYGITMVQGDQLNVGKSPVTVCIADTGVASSHPDLPRRRLNGANRYSSASNQPLYYNVDARGHGTHCTGTINAKRNQFGVRGIGKIPVYMTRALDDNGQARESDIYAAVQQCSNSGAKVISMSLGGGGMSQTFKDMLTSIYDDKGILLVAAAGNSGINDVMWPAAHPRVMAIGAVDDTATKWSGSNYGSELELAAPGKMVLSTSVNTEGQYVYRYDTNDGAIVSQYGLALTHVPASP